MNYLQVMKVTKKIICRQAPHALEESPAYVALALYVPSAAYVCNSVAVPLDAVVTTTVAEPSPKLTLMFWPPRGIESCKRRRIGGCPLKLADLNMMSNVTGSVGVLVLVEAKVTLVGVRCKRLEDSH